ncbi:uncharacterized protein LOC130537915 [Takifugu flavidus]|uniref:uncharacterized protein LOC130537915 n=1 Tax=Takifugu flavidus TaxID=433684 RepID=UPI0025441610|nr:uncharacterized protein LOC130537915 [Takifugu flavidus]
MDAKVQKSSMEEHLDPGQRSAGRMPEWRRSLNGLLIICMSVVIFASILIYVDVYRSEMLTQKSRSLREGNYPRPKRDTPQECPASITLEYTMGAPTSFQFDLCDVIDCRGTSTMWRGYDVYLCYEPGPIQFSCSRHGYTNGKWCSDWSSVRVHTGMVEQPAPLRYAGSDSYAKAARKKEHLWRELKLQRDFSPTSNPLTLSLHWDQSPVWRGAASPVYLVLGVDITGYDPMGLIKIHLKATTTVQGRGGDEPPKDENMRESNSSQRVRTLNYSALKPIDIIQISTGTGTDNVWLDWLASEAKDKIEGECIACAAGRPHLFTEPAPLHFDDTWGCQCMMALTRENTPINCTQLATIYPPISDKSTVGPFKPRRGEPNRYVCLISITGRSREYGEIAEDWCNQTIKGDASQIGSLARAGLFWYCGRGLHTKMQAGANGRCAMVRLATPVTLIGNRMSMNSPTTSSALTARSRRHILRKRSSARFDLSVGSPTYIDAIGIPRGVPEEYKLAEVAAGFENLPIIAALFPITPNKNVDRINYVHYNVQRLANLTRDAVEGLAEQLSATSMVAMQNRMALDMLLAEKEGVCYMFGEMCCTFIPNSTAPDGSVTKALEGLRSLSYELAENSGVDHGLGSWMFQMFGRWKGLIFSILTSLAAFTAAVMMCGCCCIPCIRTLCVRMITVAIEKGTTDPKMIMPLRSAPKEEVVGNWKRDGWM